MKEVLAWFAVVAATGCGRIGFDESALCVVGASGDAGVDAALATGPTYYVATDGDDSRSCATAREITTPRRTIVATLGCITGGETLVVRGGTYVEEIDSSLVSVKGGTSWDTATRFVAYPGETPILRPGPGANRVLSLASDEASFLVFDGFVFDDTNGSAAIDAAIKVTSGGSGRSHHIRIIHSEITNAPVGGIYINGGEGNELIDLRVHDNGAGNVIDGTGIHIATTGNLIERCDVYRNSKAGIEIYDQVYSTADNVVRFNRIHDNTLQGIYAGGNITPTGQRIERNVIWANNGGIDLPATAALVAHNTLVGNVGVNFNFCIDVRGQNAVVENNICWQHGQTSWTRPQ